MHTIHHSARPVTPRDSRRPAMSAAYTKQGERIVRRHSGPTALPVGTTVIEAYGARLTRGTDGAWYGRGDEALTTGELAFPVVEILPRQRGHHLTRAERRTDERVARREESKLKRFKRRRVDEYLAATAAAGIAEQRARAVAGVEQ